VEDVDHDFEIIEHDPLTRWEAINRRRASPVVFAQAGLDLVGNGFELRLRRCRTDNEEIGEAGDAGEIEDDDVFSLFVRGELGAGLG
jgi:hypothetical protein